MGQERPDNVLGVVHAPIAGDVRTEVWLVNTKEHPQEVPQPSPMPFDGICVGLAHAVAIVASFIDMTAVVGQDKLGGSLMVLLEHAVPSHGVSFAM